MNPEEQSTLSPFMLGNKPVDRQKLQDSIIEGLPYYINAYGDSLGSKNVGLLLLAVDDIVDSIRHGLAYISFDDKLDAAYLNLPGKTIPEVKKGKFNPYSEAAYIVKSIAEALPEYKEPEKPLKKYTINTLAENFILSLAPNGDADPRIWENLDEIVTDEYNRKSRPATQRAIQFAKFLDKAILDLDKYDVFDEELGDKESYKLRLEDLRDRFRDGDVTPEDLLLAQSLIGKGVFDMFSTEVEQNENEILQVPETKKGKYKPGDRGWFDPSSLEYANAIADSVRRKKWNLDIWKPEGVEWYVDKDGFKHPIVHWKAKKMTIALTQAKKEQLASLEEKAALAFSDETKRADVARLVSLFGDIVGLGGGGFNIAGGLASLGGDLVADYETGASPGQYVWDLLSNVGFTVIGMFPGGRLAKFVTKYKKTSKALLGSLVAFGLISSGGPAWNGLLKLFNGEMPTSEEWTDITNVGRAITGILQMGMRYKATSNYSKFQGEKLDEIATREGKSVYVTPEQKSEILSLGRKGDRASAEAKLKEYARDAEGKKTTLSETDGLVEFAPKNRNFIQKIGNKMFPETLGTGNTKTVITPELQAEFDRLYDLRQATKGHWWSPRNRGWGTRPGTKPGAWFDIYTSHMNRTPRSNAAAEDAAVEAAEAAVAAADDAVIIPSAEGAAAASGPEIIGNPPAGGTVAAGEPAAVETPDLSGVPNMKGTPRGLMLNGNTGVSLQGPRSPEVVPSRMRSLSEIIGGNLTLNQMLDRVFDRLQRALLRFAPPAKLSTLREVNMKRERQLAESRKKLQEFIANIKYPTTLEVKERVRSGNPKLPGPSSIEAKSALESRAKSSPKSKSNQKNYNRTTKKLQGGILAYSNGNRVTYQNIPQSDIEWYEKGYFYNHLPGWNASLDLSAAGSTINLPNALHGHAGDLSVAYGKNDAYIGQSGLVQDDILNYANSSGATYTNGQDFVDDYNSKIKLLNDFWGKNSHIHYYTKDSLADPDLIRTVEEINNTFKALYKNRSGEGKELYDIGFDEKLKRYLGSSTWLRRADKYKDLFDFNNEEHILNRVHRIKLPGSDKFIYVAKNSDGSLILLDRALDIAKIEALKGKPEELAANGQAADASPTYTNEEILANLTLYPPDGMARAEAKRRGITYEQTNDGIIKVYPDGSRILIKKDGSKVKINGPRLYNPDRTNYKILAKLLEVHGLAAGRLLHDLWSTRNRAENLKSAYRLISFLDPPLKYHQIMDDYAGNQYVSNQAALVKSLADRPISADASLNAARANQGNLLANEMNYRLAVQNQAKIQQHVTTAENYANENLAERIKASNANGEKRQTLARDLGNIDQQTDANAALSIDTYLMGLEKQARDELDELRLKDTRGRLMQLGSKEAKFAYDLAQNKQYRAAYEKYLKLKADPDKAGSLELQDAYDEVVRLRRIQRHASELAYNRRMAQVLDIPFYAYPLEDPYKEYLTLLEPIHTPTETSSISVATPPIHAHGGTLLARSMISNATSRANSQDITLRENLRTKRADNDRFMKSIWKAIDTYLEQAKRLTK